MQVTQLVLYSIWLSKITSDDATVVAAGELKSFILLGNTVVTPNGTAIAEECEFVDQTG